MRNVHIIPTDKPSRFYNNNKGEYHFREQYVPDVIETCKNHNIYITSDEQIKDRDWYIYINDGLLRQYKKEFNPSAASASYNKKIILTTDQELIKDGVQAIDDTFLEWFVKNPSCEEVENKNLNNINI